MIYWPHLFSISNVTICILKSGKLFIFTPIWIKASLRVSEDMGGIAWRMDSLESTAEKILSYDLPRFVQNWIVSNFILTHLFSSYSRPQCGIDPHLLKLYRYQRRSLGSSCTHCPQLDYYWFVPPSVYSFSSQLYWFDEEEGQYGSSRCHMQLPWWGGSLMFHTFPSTSVWTLVQLSWLLSSLYAKLWPLISVKYHPLFLCLIVE